MIEPKGPRWAKLTVALIAARDPKRCIHCGTTDTLTIQHRAVKGAGSRNSAERPSNGIILCWWANWACEADSGFAEHARARGWKISTHVDPRDVPVFDAVEGVWYELDDEWNRTPVGNTNQA